MILVITQQASLASVNRIYKVRKVWIDVKRKKNEIANIIIVINFNILNSL